MRSAIASALLLFPAVAWGQGSQPVCVRDGPAAGPNHQLCLQAAPQGGSITYNAFNGAAPLPLKCNVNGTDIANCLSGGAVTQGLVTAVNVLNFGAKGDGVTDDTAAFQAAIDTLPGPSWLGGMIFVPRGHYCLKSGPLNITRDGVTLAGENRNSSVLLACGADVSMIRMTGAHDTLLSLGVYGSDVPTTTHPAVLLVRTGAVAWENACSECMLSDVNIQRGNHAIYADNYEFYIQWSSLQQSYGNSVIYVVNTGGNPPGGGYTGGGGYLFRLKIDQGLPAGNPANLTMTVPAWAPATTYTRGDFVQIGTQMLQAMSNGTSSAVQPTPHSYGVDIPDGSVVWQFAAPWEEYYGVFMDSNTGNAMYIEDSDFSAPPFKDDIVVKNTLNQNAPSQIWISRNTFGASRDGGVLIVDGWGIHIMDNAFGSCEETTCSPISLPYVDATHHFVGDLNIRGNYILGGTTGIYIGSSDRSVITDNIIGAVRDNAVVLDQQSCCATLTGNQLGSSGLWSPATHTAVTLATGTQYNLITNNSFIGATTGVNDQSGQTNNILNNNIGP